MSKRCSESLNQDLNNDSAECLRREWDIMGIKENDTPPPSSVDCFQGVRSTGFLKGKTGKFYSLESQVGKFGPFV